MYTHACVYVCVVMSVCRMCVAYMPAFVCVLMHMYVYAYTCVCLCVHHILIIDRRGSSKVAQLMGGLFSSLVDVSTHCLNGVVTDTRTHTVLP